MEKSFKKVTARALDSCKIIRTAGLGANGLILNLALFLVDVELQHWIPVIAAPRLKRGSKGS